MSERQLWTLVYLFGGFWLAKTLVWLGFGLYLWSSGRL